MIIKRILSGKSILNSLKLRNPSFYISAMASLLVPPASVCGVTKLDRDAFTTITKVPYMQLKKESLSSTMPILKKYIIKMPKLKAVQTMSDDAIVYFNPDKVMTLSDISEKDRNDLMIQGKFFESGELILKYENWSANEILKAILPEEIEVPTSFSRIGHIIHLNLRDSQLPFKKLIGQVYLDKIPQTKTVVNKTSNIDTTYRFFTMEILAGDEDTIVTVKENKCIYQFDFAKVYWNPRLSTEHETLLTFIKPKDVMYDVFAGVGPFAIPAAKKGITVLANDLNPESYKWLQKNGSLNKINNNLTIFNLDGREFIKTVIKLHLLNRRNNNTPGCEHIVMNLPALAVEFLDAFFNWVMLEEEIKKIFCKPVTVHVYCFVKLQTEEEAKSKAVSFVEKKLSKSLNSKLLIDVHYVRNVAPNKEMMRVSFLLTEDILRGEEPVMKKIKSDNNDDTVDVGKDGPQ